MKPVLVPRILANAPWKSCSVCSVVSFLSSVSCVRQKERVSHFFLFCLDRFLFDSGLQEMIKVFESFDGMDLFDDKSEQEWIQDGLALQIKCLKERGVESEVVKPKEEEEIYFLYPEVGAIDRARDCADEFGKCSIEEMQDLIPSKFIALQARPTTQCWLTNWPLSILPCFCNCCYTALQQHRKMAAAHDVYVDETDTAWLDADEMQWLEEGLELQIALREKSRKETIKYNHLT